MLLNDMHTDWNEADNDMRDAIAVLHTAGDGYWSDVAKAVRITEVKLFATKYNDGDMFGELCVHFNTNDWRVDKDGLIYTDSTFMEELRVFLYTLGYEGSDVSYSEQGMQGDNYVSCDVGTDFIISYCAMNKDYVVEECDC